MARPLQITDETILDTLATRPGLTSAEVAETLGIGQSTAAKRLAALEAASSVRRTPGGREAGRRAPDRWDLLAVPAPLAAGSPIADPATIDAAHDAGDVGGAETDRAESDVEGASANGAPAPEVGQRLGRGELGSLVRDYLAAHPDKSFGPAAVGKALGRSQGAISNSLATMAARGDAVLVGDKPRRYRIATAG
jgi:hypothetical protein